MNVPAIQLPGRRSVMEAHARNPAFRAIAVTVLADEDRRAGVASLIHRAAGAGRAGDGDGRGGRVIAFGYGFRGGQGQWWHDLVRSALTASSGAAVARHWLDDSFEIAELHVRPEYQRRGIGRNLLFQLTGGRAERTTVLSTMDANSPARRLYRSVGFTDLLTGYRFAGAAIPYAVMGAALPLSAGRPASPRYW